MKAAWKYIVYRDDSGEEVIETFPTNTIHAAYAAQRGIARARIVAAGFVTANKECFGVSTSLGLSSRPRADSALLAGDC
ncbi:MAG: hypothetical protein AB7Q23_09425 [Hyphomonadaceae bacterium]